MITQLRHPDLGLIEIHSRIGLKRVKAQVLPDKIRITAPFGYENRLLPLSEEMTAQLYALKKRITDKDKDYIYRFDIGKEFRTLTFSVQLKRQPDPDNHYYSGQLAEGVLTIGVPQEADIPSSTVQEVIKKILRKFLIMEAKRILPDKVSYWSEKCHLQCKSVSISSAKRKWGSCDSNKNIRLAYMLMLIPERHIDYTIVHELCHTKEMNHGPGFKKMLHGFFPDYKEIEKEGLEWSKRVMLLDI